MINQTKSHLINIPGWRTNRKIVVFESDDWGMIRTTSKQSFTRLLNKGYPVDKCVYNRNDALESNTDLAELMNILSKYKDRNQNYAKFTLNNVVANPDFVAIEQGSFLNYFYESFVDTLSRYTETNQVLNLYCEGIQNKLFQLQFHGREHVNINRWLEALTAGDKRFKDAFDEQMFTVAGQGRTSGRKDYLDAFGRAYNHEIESEESILNSGLELFEKIWGFKSKSFIAPCYVWAPEIELYLVNKGVKYIQGTHVQRIPKSGLELKMKKKYHWQGRRNSSGLKSIVRNVFFEPADSNSQPSSVDKAMAQIKVAFDWHKPAVISSHRVNYISRINQDNRDKNLLLLDELLTKIIGCYPDVNFMSSDELGDLFE